MRRVQQTAAEDNTRPQLLIELSDSSDGSALPWRDGTRDSSTDIAEPVSEAMDLLQAPVPAAEEPLLKSADTGALPDNP